MLSETEEPNPGAIEDPYGGALVNRVIAKKDEAEEKLREAQKEMP